MAKLMNFDAETLSSSLKDTQPRPRVGVKSCSFGSVTPSLFIFQLQFFLKSLLCTTANYFNC